MGMAGQSRLEHARKIVLAIKAMGVEQSTGAVERMCAGDDELKREVLFLLEGPTSTLPAERAAADSIGGMARAVAPTRASVSEELLRHIPSKYTVQRVLGEGGMGVVYLASMSIGGDGSRDRPVAVKVLRPSVMSAAGIRALEREVDAMLRLLSIPSVARIVDADLKEVGGYIVSDYIDGWPLHYFVRDVGVSVRERMRLFIDICDTMAAVHQQGIIHRDIKPSNILIRRQRQGHRWQPVIVDFGISADRASNPQEQLDYVGTPGFMAPEQRSDPGQVGVRTDVYALGMTLYWLLHERLPGGDGEPKTAGARVGLEALGRVGAERVHEIMQKCLRPRPVERYQSAAEVADALRACPIEGVTRAAKAASTPSSEAPGQKKPEAVGKDVESEPITPAASAPIAGAVSKSRMKWAMVIGGLMVATIAATMIPKMREPAKPEAARRSEPGPLPKPPSDGAGQGGVPAPPAAPTEQDRREHARAESEALAEQSVDRLKGELSIQPEKRRDELYRRAKGALEAGHLLEAERLFRAARALTDAGDWQADELMLRAALCSNQMKLWATARGQLKGLRDRLEAGLKAAPPDSNQRSLLERAVADAVDLERGLQSAPEGDEEMAALRWTSFNEHFKRVSRERGITLGG